MQTEYTGHRLLALLQEVRQRGWRGSAWRAAYELRSRLGMAESYFRAEPLGVEELRGLFDPPPAGPTEFRRMLHERLCQTSIISPDDRDQYAQAVAERCPDRLDGLITAADGICHGRFEFMGKRLDFRDGPIDWHLEPESGGHWKRERWNRTGLYDADAPGDVKFTWELNRHQFWPTLGRAYWLTGDDRYVRAWVDQITSWLDDNPPEIGVNWRSNLEHAIRIVNWLTALALFLPAPQLSDELVCRIVGTMILKARHIVADLDYSRINMPNNHLLGDAMGLAAMGLVLPDLPEAREWRDLGLGTLWSEAPRQIHPDGASFECAISYHRFVAYFYVLILRLCEKSGVAVPDVVRRRLEGMFEFVLHLRRPDGGMPSIGDWDDGRTVMLSEQAVDDFRPMLSTGAVLFGRPDLAWASGGLDEETLWLLGPQAGEEFDAIEPTQPTDASRSFPDGGYYISRSDWSGQAHHAVLRNGPFDSHAHADLLNVEMSAWGQPLIVDPGTYTYNGAWEWRTHFRSAATHNGLIVDGQGQTCAHRIFRWLFPPTARTLAWHSGSTLDYFEGQHDGFRRLPGSPCHRRIMLSIPGQYWLVVDGLLGAGRHDVELRFHFDPSMDVSLQDRRLVASGPENVGATLDTWSTVPLVVETVRGREDPIAGWFSPGYGSKIPTTMARITSSGELPIWIAWLVVPYRDAPGRVSLRSAGDDRDSIDTGPRLTVELDDVVDTFTYRLDDDRGNVPASAGGEHVAGATWARANRDTGEVLSSWSRPPLR